MGFTELGHQNTDVPKTPTLRQWCKQNPGTDVHVSQVKFVFNPGSFASYSFVTEHNFRVSVEKETPLASFLEQVLPNALREGVCLYIQIKNHEKGSWAISALNGNEVEWQEAKWGWKAGEVRATKPDPKKTRPNVSKLEGSQQS